ncbi:MucR family transcriptional regulator [Streptomyces sp. NBC_01498]|uniref:MucR family transcriptional regulator n=1 Tax=Streptomyces sp. NBC_01498 TaxID=2975870 RepID=UPI002E7B1BDF|nr:MucR family transcriptional regulator [Streptomyces sp. NBC_01498]WTL28420.1 MucR family transcriptional regulator [Streptomyces sp. NBC_01498]
MSRFNGSQDVVQGARHSHYGQLIRDEDTDTVVCHVCGRAFRSLGAHVRVHRMTAAEYRQEFGLLRTKPLSARSLSQEQSRAHVAIYAASEEARGHLSAGQDMARSGELSRKRRDADRGRPDPPQLRQTQQDSLTAGRGTRASAADARLATALRAGGFGDLGQALHALYVTSQHSIDDTARALSIGRGRVRRLLAEHGIAIRSTGQNSAAGRRARALLNDRKAAQRVGTPDIASWLRERRKEGATFRELAKATGRSIPWVTARTGTCGPSRTQ